MARQPKTNHQSFEGENRMSKDFTRAPIKRRTVLQAGLAIGAAQIARPFVVKSLADEPVKIAVSIIH
jgi:hypothetical protein